MFSQVSKFNYFSTSMLYLNRFKNLEVRTQMLILSAIFIAINLAAVISNNLEYIRIMRVASTVAVFFFFLIQIRHYSKWFYVIFVLLTCSSVGFYNYDLDFGPLLFLSSNSIIYLILGIWIFTSIDWVSIKRYEYISYIAIYAINIAFHLYNVDNVKDNIDSNIVLILVTATGVIGITACLAAGLSNATRSTYNSAYFMFAVFSFVFADFAAMLAYYYELFPQRFYFLERAGYLFGLYILSRYLYLENDDSKTEVIDS